MRYILPILIFASICWSQPDPNIPVLRSYVTEPDVKVPFGFWVRDYDGIAGVNVKVSGPVHWLAPRVVDPNGLMVAYRGNLGSDVMGEYFLLIEADDGEAVVFGYLKFIVKRRNHLPEIL